uniref:Elongation of very long chain fatty acids protein n=1 Tax=Rhabditophanes sp. KR3021 TaxID=114890 RepID=A0AC35U6S5_9BILA
MATALFSNLQEKVLSAPKFDLNGFLDVVTSPKFSEKKGKDWIIDQFPLAIQLSCFYVVVVFGIKFLMRNRQPFTLTVPLNIWNFILAAFSIMGTIQLTSEFFGTIASNGLFNSYCKNSNLTEGHSGYWVWLFIVSKMFELTDTVFLVLRKRPLMFLHWYHHILTLLYAFFSYPSSPGFNRWGIYLNFFVHAFMYSYYFLRSMKIRVPGFIAQFITSIQILQFIISCAVLFHSGFAIYIQGAKCDFDTDVFVVATFMDVTYLALFINFFLKSYVIGGGKTKYQDKKVKSN